MDIMTPEEWNNENYPYPNCRSILHNGREMEKRMKDYSDYVLRESQNSSTSDEALPIADVGQSLPDAEQCLKIQEQVKQYCYVDQDDNPVISSGGIRAVISRWKQMIE